MISRLINSLHSHANGLAWAELYIAIMYIFRRFELQLYDTVKERDVDNVRECSTGDTTRESPNVRVKITKVFVI